MIELLVLFLRRSIYLLLFLPLQLLFDHNVILLRAGGEHDSKLLFFLYLALCEGKDLGQVLQGHLAKVVIVFKDFYRVFDLSGD